MFMMIVLSVKYQDIRLSRCLSTTLNILNMLKVLKLWEKLPSSYSVIL